VNLPTEPRVPFGKVEAITSKIFLQKAIQARVINIQRRKSNLKVI
jgi:hypothetical protein